MLQRIVLPFLACLALAACEQREVDEQGQVIEVPLELASTCEPVIFEERAFTHCVADPARHVIRMVHADTEGEDYGSLARLAALRPVSAPPVAFAINGGLLEGNDGAIGYYVEDGERLRRIVRGEDSGGIFFGEHSADWRIWNAQRFFDNVTTRPDFGMQSAPMLIQAGELTPQVMTEDGAPQLQSGVGVDSAGRAHFLISNEPVTLESFARYFRDVLRTPNALHLDDDVSQLWDPASGRLDPGPQLGPLIVVEMRENGA